ncbi:MAG: glucose-1-phosphate cytidylyltransferase [Candidatus Sericytochromatia bacterium]|nr:MAG: glucose-1-phosphate cytidylyltransferase [Candidatus Sericytochromatia bacterium]GIX42967.1 MAG: glucose-1-phosphate cytidylyltransferase [Leptospiraceae bacterium]
MKVVILAGGFGTRLSEETEIRPKPMVEIGGKPILWHIMKIYTAYGFSDFVILLGYKGYMIKEYFANYYLHQSDVTIDLKNNTMKIHNSKAEPWIVTLVDTGINTMTGGRIKQAKKYIGNERFMLTYGDGLGDVNINELLNFHNSHDGYISVTSVQPEGRFGALNIYENNKVTGFVEKPKGDGHWINGGFFVCEPEVFEYIEDEINTVFEQEPLRNLAKDGKMYAYRHTGFWKAMDTLRDKKELERLWNSGNAPWKVWND